MNIQIYWLDWNGKSVIIFLFVFLLSTARTFFLLGQKPLCSLLEIQAAWQNTIDPLILRKFLGSETKGWKIAWSDRMISFHTSVWLFAVIWLPFRRKIKPLPWWRFVLLFIPVARDGGTHMFSDFAGIGQSFRDTNQ
ncbi:MAG: hypothetical protein ABIQ77_01415 [Anaerolineales bacterium]